MFFKWFFKAAVAIYLVTNTYDNVMAVFDIGQNVLAGAAGVISGDTNNDIESTHEQMRTSMETMGIGELLGLSIETLLISLCLKIMSIVSMLVRICSRVDSMSMFVSPLMTPAAPATTF